MTTARWQQVEDLYHAALACDERRRTAWLDEACRGDQALRREVDTLLAQASRASRFLESLPWMSSTRSAACEADALQHPSTLRLDDDGLFAGRYRIDRAIGAGGMGVVYRAEDVRLKRGVALKFLGPSASTRPDARRQFLREAQAAAALDDPHVCTVFEAGEHEGQAFIAMALIDGPTLKERLQAGALPVAEAIAIAGDVAAGLAAAHAKGVVHRDIKPGNVLLASGRVATITDFGLARFERTDDSTQPGGGTPAYMSPEQVQGLRIDHRTDIWALGCVLHEMLTGRSPFVTASGHIDVFAIVHDAHDGHATLPPDVPPALAAIVDRCLQRELRQRYQTAVAVLRDLEAVRLGANPSHPSAIERRRDMASIAVLPFADMSHDRSQAHVAEGIAEELIHALTRIDGLRVVARTSTFAVKARGLDVREIGRVLDVATVLEGSVRTSGSRVRITAQLIDVEDGCHLWSERFDRDASDIFAIQDEITASIVDHLQGTMQIATRSLPARAPVDPEAYALYLKGQYFFHRPSPESLQAALRFYSDAVERAPAFARAHAGIAGVWTDLCVFKAILPGEGWPRARAALDQALELDPNLPEALVVAGIIGLWYDWDWTASEAAFARALALNPGDAFGLGAYANLLMVLGRIDESLAAIAQALVRDPLSPLLYGFSTGLHAASRRPDDALRDFARAQELAPMFGLSHVHAGLAYLAAARLDEAAAILESGYSAGGFAGWADCVLGVVRARQGRRDAAAEILQRLLEQDERGNASSMAIGWTHAALGDHDAAFMWFDRAYDERDGFMVWVRVYTPIFAPALLHDRRYHELLARLHLPGVEAGGGLER